MEFKIYYIKKIGSHIHIFVTCMTEPLLLTITYKGEKLSGTDNSQT